MNPKGQPVIFVVEDNLFYQQLIAKELESLSDTIYFYTNGENCLRELDKGPTIIIMDYNLDGSLNGLETLQQVKRINPSIRVIVFSSDTELHTRENLLKYGRFHFLEKTMQSFRELKQVVMFAELQITD